jgi:hypothetical protein
MPVHGLRKKQVLFLSNEIKKAPLRTFNGVSFDDDSICHTLAEMTG